MLEGIVESFLGSGGCCSSGRVLDYRFEGYGFVYYWKPGFSFDVVLIIKNSTQYVDWTYLVMGSVKLVLQKTAQTFLCCSRPHMT